MNGAWNRKSALLVVALGYFLVTFTISSVNVALPSIGKEFALDAVSLSWVVATYLLTSVMFLLPFGKLADTGGRKKIFVYGALLFALASFFSGIANVAVVLICFRALQGIGCGMILATGIAILTSVFPIGERGTVFGINTASVYLGYSVGPFLGGFLTQNLGWRSIFFVGLLVALTTFALGFWKIATEKVDVKKERFDFVGSSVYGVTLLLVIYGFSSLPATSGALLIMAGIFGFLIFIQWEKRTKNPILRLEIFSKNLPFKLSNIAALINYSATFPVSFLLSLYLQHVRGFSSQNAGIILLAQPIMQAIFSPISGKLSDRIEPRIVSSAGMAVTAVGLFLFAILDVNTALWFIEFSLVLIGFGFALFAAPNTNAVMSSVKQRFYGIASATLSTMRQTGQVLSMGVVTLIFSIYIGRVQITPEYYPQLLSSTRVAFEIFGALCSLGVLASFFRGRVRTLSSAR